MCGMNGRKIKKVIHSLKPACTKLVEQIVKDYEKKAGGLPKDYATPGLPGITLPKLTDEEDIVNHGDYMSLVGKIMYLTTKILPEFANVAR